MNNFPFYIRIQNLLPGVQELQVILSKNKKDSHLLAYSNKTIKKADNLVDFYRIFHTITVCSGRALEFLESGADLEGCTERLLSLYPELAQDPSKPLKISVFRLFRGEEIKIDLVCDGNKVDCRQMVPTNSKHKQAKSYETKVISYEDFIRTALVGMSVSDISYAIDSFLFSWNFVDTLVEGPREDNPLLLAFKNQI